MQTASVNENRLARISSSRSATGGCAKPLSGTLAVDQLMRELCGRPARNSLLADALQHHLASGGGRTRARLELSAADALGLCDGDALVMAAAVELLHNASLVQDDMQDGERSRRGRESVWARYGKNAAIGLTDLMISAAYCALAELSCVQTLPALHRRLHSAVAKTLHGQTLDLERHHQASFAVSLEVARSKSGPLFALALELPLIAAGLESRVEEAHRAACAFGSGYQVADDLQDVQSDRAAGVGSNIVLVLERSLGADEARGQARRLACLYLRIATRGASALPRGSGDLLSALAHRVIRQLEEPYRV